MPDAHSNSDPAYPGARFDAAGMCLNHSDVRLSVPTEDGKFRTVRKICAKCGTAGLHSKAQKTRLHHQRKKVVPQRDLPCKPSSAAASDANSNSTREGSTMKKPDQRSGRGRRPRRPTPVPVKGSHRRTRTLSPPRKSEPKKSSRPSSAASGMKQQVTKEKIANLMQLLPPLYHPGSSVSGSSASLNPNSGQPKPARKATKQKMPFDEQGRCRAHPEVRVAKKDAKGGWNLVSGVCPQCCVSAVLACKQEQDHEQPADEHTNDFDDLIGRVINSSITTDASKRAKSESGARNGLGGKLSCSDSHQTQPTSPSSSYRSTYQTSPTSSQPSTPGSASSPKPAFSASYFTAANRNIIGLAMDIQKSERMVSELNESCVSEATERQGNVAFRKYLVRDPPPSREPPGRRFCEL